jgi:hypothetical protein
MRRFPMSDDMGIPDDVIEQVFGVYTTEGTGQ